MTARWLVADAGLEAAVGQALLAEDTRPRVLSQADAAGGALVILRGVNLMPGAEPEDMVSIRIWAEKGRVISVCLRELRSVTDLRARLGSGQGPRTTGELIVMLIGRLTEHARPVVGAIEEEFDDLEESALGPTPDHLATTLRRLRRRAITLRRFLVPQRDAVDFTLADACRMAGVSTAAPYRHFNDRDALVDAVTTRAFDLLAERTRSARDAHPEGSIEAIVAMGRAYVAFAADEREMFELMWARHVLDLPADASEPAGKACFAILLEAVDRYRRRHRLAGHETLSIAVPLWTLVHGAASLVLGRNIEAVAPQIDVDRMIDDTTRAYFGGLHRSSEAPRPPSQA